MIKSPSHEGEIIKYFLNYKKMNDDHSTRTEIVYRSIIERLFSEMKKQVQSEEDKQCIKDLKEVKNYFIYFFLFK